MRVSGFRGTTGDILRRSALGAACLVAAFGACAQARQADFDLAPGPIERVLPEYARQAGVQLVAPGAQSGAVAAQPVAPLRGRMDTRVALARLLAGTRLVVARDDGDTITLREAPLYASAGAVALPPPQDAAPPPPATTAPPDAPPQDASAQQSMRTLDQVTVVGTQIRGSAAAAILPVNTLDRKQIEATGAVTGDDLYRSIPQMGDVTFSGVNGGNSSNYARGDIAAVNLRGLGVGNTLVLINGRRTVVHPTSQADDQLVPVLTYNANAIPVPDLARVEVLLDGAAAIYGTDAVAGVVNNVLRDDFDGGRISVQRGFGEGTGMRDTSVNGLFGRNFADARGNVTLAYSWYNSTGLNSLDQDWTSTTDRRFDFEGTRFEDANTLDGRSTASEWGNFSLPAGTGAIDWNGVALTSPAGVFHSQPQANGDCGAVIADGVCIGSGTKQTSGRDRNTRSDAAARWPISLVPDVNRLNLFLTSKYAFDNGLEFFSETGYYQARARSLQEPVNSISSLPMTVPASNYWNPFGATTLPDGSPNPNRLPGLDIPDAGLPVTITSYRFAFPTEIRVDNKQYRLLAGLRGSLAGFDWETALSYSRASVRDDQGQVSLTLMQQALADATPAAYNPFVPDNTPESSAPFRIHALRKSTTSLAMWDFKASRPDLLHWRAGDIGLAVGGEVRRETQRDDRDARVDGTIGYTDQVTGARYDSDLFGVSPSPDTSGARTVEGLFAELSVPLVGADMHVPLVRSLELQLAGRGEHYSDFGSVAKPKIALGWELFDGLRLRASWAKGFRAPNLEQVNATVVTRSNTRTDYVQCEADLRRGAIDGFSDCNHSASTTARRSGNPDLKPETSDNYSAGLVFQPKFLPASLGRLQFSADYYVYHQKGIIGLFGEGNALILDYLMRVQGSSNPNVVRADPTADDVARYAGTGLAPAGRVLYVLDQYVNLQPQTVRGMDFAASWSSPETRAGRFDASITGTHLIEFYRDPSPAIAELIAARDAGTINPGTTITGGGNLIGQSGKPEWKWTGNFTWSRGPVTVGGSVRYTSSYHDIYLVDDEGVDWTVESGTFGNLFARYDFGDARTGWLSGASVKLGVNNVGDRRPPVTSNTYGYDSSLYQPYPRYWYVSVAKDF